MDKKNKKLMIGGAAVVLLIVIIGILALARNGAPNGYNTTATANITMSTSVLPPPMINGAEVQAIISTSSMNADFGTYNKYSYTTPYPCNSTLTDEFFFEPPLNSTTAPFNFSKLNEARPFEVYLALWMVNSSYVYEYNSIFNSNKGYCNPSLAPILGNSTFSSQPITMDNQSGYLMTFSNFTEAGLNLTNNPYTGKKPDIVWYVSSFLVANLKISVGEMGFANNTSPGLVINYTKGPLEQAVQFAKNSQ